MPIQQEIHGVMKMRRLFFVGLILIWSQSAIGHGGAARNRRPREEASGLIATILNTHPLGDGTIASSSKLERGFCCCSSTTCPPTLKDADYDDINDADLVGIGLINVRTQGQVDEDAKKDEPDIALRIVNNPPPSIQTAVGAANAQLLGTQCPINTKTCCYSSKDYVTGLGTRCLPAAGGSIESAWRQGCAENIKKVSGPGTKLCGERRFSSPAGLRTGEASVDEFPWACLILNSNNDFIGGCAIVPENRQNDISQGTKRVITVAHKLATLKRTDLLKVRILEYDASGFTTKETVKHQEYTVVRFIKHPRYDPKRLSNDIAVLILEKPINLVQFNGINAACYPGCRNMFEYTFPNGTGTRCWVAGWGKDDYEGDYQFIQHKVDVPMYDRIKCDVVIRNELSKTNSELAKQFSLHPGELCAGGEKGKDACEGDGGAPLVCQSDSGLFHIVGLVAWGVNCALENIPGIYTNVYNYIDFITQNF